MPDHDVDPREPLRSELATEVRRVADRLRSMSQARLEGQVAPSEAGFPPYGSRAEAARTVASALADAAAALTGEATHVLPVLSDFAAGDQLAVAGHDLLVAVAAADPAGRDRVADAIRLLSDLRRRL